MPFKNDVKDEIFLRLTYHHRQAVKKNIKYE